MRRLLIGLLAVIVAATAIVLLTSRGEEDPRGETELGMRGFPLRGSLAEDTEAIDAAVAEWREETAEDAEEAEEDDDDPETRERHARRPDEDDDVTVLWIGRADEREEIAILESQGGLLALLTRREAGAGWFVRSERVRTEDDFAGSVPIGVGDAVLTPARNEWRFAAAGYGNAGFEDAGDGLFWSDGGSGDDGFVLPRRPSRDRVPIYVTGVGGRLIRPDAYETFTAALTNGYERAVYLAAEQASEQLRDERNDQPPELSVEWTGELPGYEHAALVLHDAATRAAVVGYGDRPARSEDKDEGTVRLGTGAGTRGGDPNTFVAGGYTAFDEFPYLLLAGSGTVDTLHALVGTEEVRRKAPFAVIDARRFDPKDRADTVLFGRTATGAVVAPFQRSNSR